MFGLGPPGLVRYDELRPWTEDLVVSPDDQDAQYVAICDWLRPWEP